MLFLRRGLSTCPLPRSFFWSRMPVEFSRAALRHIFKCYSVSLNLLDFNCCLLKFINMLCLESHSDLLFLLLVSSSIVVMGLYLWHFLVACLLCIQNTVTLVKFPSHSVLGGERESKMRVWLLGLKEELGMPAMERTHLYLWRVQNDW